MITGKLESVIWFLKRPRLYPQFLHLIKLKLFQKSEPDTRAESELWCAALATDVAQAVQQITGVAIGAPIAETFKPVFDEARKKAEACPVVMGGPGALDLLYYLAKNLKAQRVIETGVAYGWSSLALLLALREHKAARLISTDMPYVRGKNDPYVGCVVPDDLKKCWEIIKLSDLQALPQALNKLSVIDLCHYDSDKTYRGRLWAYPKLWSALKKGGCFISDDIGDNVGFRDFARQLGLKPIVVRLKTVATTTYVGILIK